MGGKNSQSCKFTVHASAEKRSDLSTKSSSSFVTIIPTEDKTPPNSYQHKRYVPLMSKRLGITMPDENITKKRSHQSFVQDQCRSAQKRNQHINKNLHKPSQNVDKTFTKPHRNLNRTSCNSELIP
ncbi:hypothetical protein KC19_11G030400 [Ceratodon purpureus]|uniref:Uncharacterized protein n=1 Tax=Ceratodon purpureus TaxID=3225 RepID=A0A8T0GCR5_CERPU|nr:hypothetical protein KC19_11G030400 [Ceratodon purpureus]